MPQAGSILAAAVEGSTSTTDTEFGRTEDPGYVMGRTEHETQRLRRQGQLYGPLTRRLLVAAGVGLGMRILDVGSGAGDVALLLADLVGPTGSVVGIDTNAEILAVARQRVLALGWTNVSFVTGQACWALAAAGQHEARSRQASRAASSRPRSRAANPPR
jgi:tRNA A58 N-methylase Trm61